MLARRALSSLILVVLGGCATSKLYEGIDAHAVADPKVNVKGLHTFAWAMSAAGVHEATREWQAPDFDVTDEVNFQIERGLRDKGMKPVLRNPDVYVAYLMVANVEEAKLIRDRAGDLSLQDDSAGALVVELMDPSTLKPVWRGAAVAPVRDDLSTEERRDRIGYAVREILAKLPR